MNQVFIKIRDCTVPSGPTTATLNIWNGLKASFGLMCILKNQDYIGQKTSDSMVFSRKNLKRMSFLINYQAFPKYSLEFDIRV